jgi:hypothetical protein
MPKIMDGLDGDLDIAPALMRFVGVLAGRRTEDLHEKV